MTRALLLIAALGLALSGCPTPDDDDSAPDDDDTTVEDDDDSVVVDDDDSAPDDDDSADDDDDVSPEEPRRFLIPLIEEDELAVDDGGLDALLMFLYAADPTGEGDGSAEIALDLFAPDGSPLLDAAGAPLCAPCTATVSAEARSAVFRVDAMLAAAGGHPGAFRAWGAVEVTGPTPWAVVPTGRQERGLGEGSMRLEPIDIVELDVEPTSRRFLPITYEMEGGPADDRSDLLFTFAHGGEEEALVELWLFDPQGQPATLDSDPICAPCTRSLDAGTPWVDLRLEDWIVTEERYWFLDLVGVLDVSGPGADDVAALARVEHSVGAGDVGKTSVPLSPPRPDGEPATWIAPGFYGGAPWIDMQFVTSAGGLVDGAGPDDAGAFVDWFLLDPETGEPLLSATGEEICNPCDETLGDGNRSAWFEMDDRAAQVGGLDDIAEAIAVTTVSGPGVAGVGATRKVLSIPSEEGVETNYYQYYNRTLVLPQLLEFAGNLDAGDFNADVFATYTAGLGFVPDGTGGAAVSIYLFDQDTGVPLTSTAGAEVCTPCSIAVGAGGDGQSPRRAAVNVRTLTEEAGGFPTGQMVNAFAILVSEGTDDDRITAHATVTNARSDGLDLSVFTVPPAHVGASD